MTTLPSPTPDPASTVAGVEQFILSGQPEVVRPLLDLLDTDPEVAVLSVAGASGPNATPWR